MKPEKKKEAIRILDMVAEDMENDVRYYEGKPFTGRNVSEFFGKIAAAVKAVATVMREMIDET